MEHAKGWPISSQIFFSFLDSSQLYIFWWYYSVYKKNLWTFSVHLSIVTYLCENFVRGKSRPNLPEKIYFSSSVKVQWNGREKENLKIVCVFFVGRENNKKVVTIERENMEVGKKKSLSVMGLSCFTRFSRPIWENECKSINRFLRLLFTKEKIV